jgi:lysophospholipase L1-like esterase
MKNLFFLSIIYLSLVSCLKNNDYKSVNPVTVVDTIHKSYLALGDSYTIGASVADTERFPVQTIKLLRQHDVDVDNPDIIATSGWTTTDLLSALNTDPPKKAYSVVTLLIGVNNQYQGKSLTEYKTDFTELLERSIFYAGNIKNHVFVISIPDYSVTPFASASDTAMIARGIDAFNAVNKSISLNGGVHYLDITSISREAKSDSALIASDGLHPSATQYKKWSELLAPMMLKEF